MQVIDMETWPRRELFEMFSHTERPFYSLSFRVDVTQLYDYTHARGLSFYCCMGRCVCKALNSVENFRYSLRDGKVVLLDERLPSFTELRPGSDNLIILTMPSLYESAEAYCAAVKAKKESQKTTVDMSTETDNLAYLSSVPWLDMTGVVGEGMTDKDDNIPRFTWGKWTEQNGRKTLVITAEVNHRFVDGVHIGRFAEALQREFAAL